MLGVLMVLQRFVLNMQELFVLSFKDMRVTGGERVFPFPFPFPLGFIVRLTTDGRHYHFIADTGPNPSYNLIDGIVLNCFTQVYMFQMYLCFSFSPYDLFAPVWFTVRFALPLSPFKLFTAFPCLRKK